MCWEEEERNGGAREQGLTESFSKDITRPLLQYRERMNV